MYRYEIIRRRRSLTYEYEVVEVGSDDVRHVYTWGSRRAARKMADRLNADYAFFLLKLGKVAMDFTDEEKEALLHCIGVTISEGGSANDLEGIAVKLGADMDEWRATYRPKSDRKGKIVKVTSAQKFAAQTVVRRAEEKGKTVSDAVRKIAEAKYPGQS